MAATKNTASVSSNSAQKAAAKIQKEIKNSIKLTEALAKKAASKHQQDVTHAGKTRLEQEIAVLKKLSAVEGQSAQKLSKIKTVLSEKEAKLQKKLDKDRQKELKAAAREAAVERFKGTSAGKLASKAGGDDVMDMAKGGGMALLTAGILAAANAMYGLNNQVKGAMVTSAAGAGDLKKVIADLDKVALTTANITPSMSALGKKFDTTGVQMKKRIADLTKETRVLESTLLSTFGKSGPTMMEVSLGLSQTFGTTQADMLNEMQRRVDDLSAKSLPEAANQIGKIYGAASSLGMTSSELYSDLLSLNTQFVHLGDQTNNFLKTSMALKNAGLPKWMQKDGMKAIIGGFDGMSEGMKTMMGLSQKGVGGSVGKARFAQRGMRGDVTKQSAFMMDFLKQTTGKNISAKDIEASEKGTASTAIADLVDQQIRLLHQSMDLNEDQALAFLKAAPGLSGKDPAAAKALEAALKAAETKNPTVKALGTVAAQIETMENGILKMIMNKIQAFAEDTAIKLGEIMAGLEKWFGGKKETPEEKKAKIEKRAEKDLEFYKGMQGLPPPSSKPVPKKQPNPPGTTGPNVNIDKVILIPSPTGNDSFKDLVKKSTPSSPVKP